jgi:hypothetical protein
MRLAILLAIGLMAYLTFTNKATGSVDIVNKIRSAAVRHGVDPELAVAIARVESNLNPKAKGASNEHGLFQLHPKFHLPYVDDLDSHIDAALGYLVRVQLMCGERFGSASFVCFNHGPNTNIKEPTRTQYYKRVTAELQRMRNGGLND